MSCDWFIHCVDCNESAMRGETNWWDQEMAALCRNADAIVDMAEVIAKLTIGLMAPCVRIDDSFQSGRPLLDLEFFKKHKGHKLVPMNEYGALLDECAASFPCVTCGRERRCTLPVKHEGDHDDPRGSPQ